MEKDTLNISAEAAMARYERIIKRLVYVILALIIAIVAIVGISTYERLQYDYTSEESNISYSQDGYGINNINAGTQGDVN